MKAQHQHTPGPWRIVDTGNEPSVRIYSPRDDSPGSLNNFAVAIGVQSDADARLIAAAPDLLEALERVLEEYALDMTPNMRNTVRQAILKAKA